MIKTYKYRIYPTKDQKLKIVNIFNAVCFVHNYYLNKYIDGGYCKNNLDKTIINNLKYENNKLIDIDNEILYNVAYNVTSLIEKSRCNNGKPPKKKNVNDYRISFKIKNNESIYYQNKHIYIKEIGNIKVMDNYIPNGKILNAIILKTINDKYYISLCCVCDMENKQFKKTSKDIGIDLGISNYITLSSGEKIYKPNYTDKQFNKITLLQRKLSQKKYNSSNYIKIKQKICNLEEHIVNKRKDFINKTSTWLVKNYDIICVENLDIKELMKNNALSYYITDSSWYELIRQLKYKTKWYGKRLVIIDRWYPSSQLCSNCNYKNPKIKNISVRKWICPKCGTIHDRDVNAAINILNEGLKLVYK